MPESGEAGEEPCQLLLVEDEEMVRQVLLRALQRFGFSTCAASTGAEALHLAERHAATLRAVVTDVVLPDLSGQELARRLRERLPELGVLLISGYGGEEVSRGGTSPPGTELLSKPFSPEDLARRVRLLVTPPLP